MRDKAFEFLVYLSMGIYYGVWDIKDKVVGIFR
ncbi:hypothetical protein [Bacillus phage Megatron]|uniref:Uncharacterized protein n=3 Tax=Wphvirus megatron TaxID=1987728 RepID=A0A024B239_9CAUD|nr:hypothetical protein FP75_gp082 [Bacillus phage Megatron]YP_009278104.1 hypothetical protein BI007_gp288 [Bacillus phage DIGNKC]YP_009280457.1 hypothetical protein BI039_gp292 [Bacillus phage Belinda]YP_009280889.1 hypothetical protein SAGEFAYGE_86 [Bacillus phage SageFayge]YP_009285030.1 hypothetical protein BIZ88_gp088 [Bacillus phage DirtyBetty]YP_009286963.1 hypothetical protein BI006_gp087 [Bacillus phage Nemo]YP_009291662.1 hypothetical protein BI001_gp291 [Bacillus phage Zuko]AOZ61